MLEVGVRGNRNERDGRDDGNSIREVYCRSHEYDCKWKVMPPLSNLWETHLVHSPARPFPPTTASNPPYPCHIVSSPVCRKTDIGRIVLPHMQGAVALLNPRMRISITRHSGRYEIPLTWPSVLCVFNTRTAPASLRVPWSQIPPQRVAPTTHDDRCLHNQHGGHERHNTSSCSPLQALRSSCCF